MEALHTAIALSQTTSVDSDTSRTFEGAPDRALHRRHRRKAKPVRSAFSSDTPSECLSRPAAVEYQTPSLINEGSSCRSPVIDSSHAVHLEEVPQIALAAAKGTQHSRGGKGSTAQRQGPCGHCKTPYSPQWRKGPRNKPVLCNACGIRYLRNRHLGRAVPPKKRFTGASASPVVAGDTPTDMRGSYKKRRTKQAAAEEEEDLSDFSYDASAHKTYGSFSHDTAAHEAHFGSAGSLQHFTTFQQHQQAFSDTDSAAPDVDTTPHHRCNLSGSNGGNSGSLAGGFGSTQMDQAAAAEAAAGPSGYQGAAASQLTHFGSSTQPLLGSVGSFSSSSLGAIGSGLYGGALSLALALHLHQQQQQAQQQQTLYGQQYSQLLSQGSTGTQGSSVLTGDQLGVQPVVEHPPGSLNALAAAAAASYLQRQASNSNFSSSGQLGSASSGGLSTSVAIDSLLLTRALQSTPLQANPLQAYHLRQQQTSSVLQVGSMLHGPSPLSVMSSGHIGDLSLGVSGGLASLLVGRAASTAEPPAAAAAAAVAAAPVLEIAPLACGDTPANTGAAASQGPAPALPAAAAATAEPLVMMQS